MRYERGAGYCRWRRYAPHRHRCYRRKWDLQDFKALCQALRVQGGHRRLMRQGPNSARCTREERSPVLRYIKQALVGIHERVHEPMTRRAQHDHVVEHQLPAVSNWNAHAHLEYSGSVGTVSVDGRETARLTVMHVFEE